MSVLIESNAVLVLYYPYRTLGKFVNEMSSGNHHFINLDNFFTVLQTKTTGFDKYLI